MSESVNPHPSQVTAIVLAAGKGTRMRSATPKVLHLICGWPMVRWPIIAARAAGVEKVIVVDNVEKQITSTLSEDVDFVVQKNLDGTGGALRAVFAQHQLNGTVLVLAGDVPLVSSDALQKLLERHHETHAAATMVTTELDDPTGYGRVVYSEDGLVQRVVETKTAGDANPEELLIREVNTGIFAFEAKQLEHALALLRPDNVQGELYLPDTLPVIRAQNGKVVALKLDDPDLVRGVNDRCQLAEVTAIAQARIHAFHQRNGVTIIDPTSTWIDAGVTIGCDSVIQPGTLLQGKTAIGENCHIGPHATVIDTQIGDRSAFVHSYATSAQVGCDVSVGPFAYLRPATIIGDQAKVGTFVELKNTNLGARAKVPHLSYLGDADVGERSNLGAGTITANYDGFHKHRTVIGSDVRGGVDTAFVAPVEVGNRAWTAAGSVITEDVPAGALAVARSRQHTVVNYTERHKAANGK